MEEARLKVVGNRSGTLAGIAWLAVAAALWMSCSKGIEGPVLDDLPLGGNFSLIDQNGEPFELDDLRGKVGLLFFGYTSCPDICPLTLARLSMAYTHIGERSGEVTTVLVTVDPARDDPQRLETYLGGFPMPSIGLTGSLEEITSVAKLYAAYFAKSETESAAGDLYDHSGYVYLIDQEGRTRYLFGQTDSPEFIAAGVRELLEG